MVVFNFIFGTLAKVPTGGIPYPIFSFAGLLPWGLFTKAIGDAGTVAGAKPDDDHQDLFSSAGNPDGLGPKRSGRFWHFFPGLDRHHAVL